MNHLKELRRINGLKQCEIADMLHLSQGSISQWENGKTNIDYEYAKTLANLFNVSVGYLLGTEDTSSAPETPKKQLSGFRIPVIGTIRAGIPVAAIEDIEDWEEIPQSVAKTGEFVALRVRGDSMEPKISDGDIAIIRRQETIESGQIAAVLVNGEDATLKKVKLLPDGIMLVAFNNEIYEPHYYSAEEVHDLPVRIYGRLVEVRSKY